jgi:hypothetical protein
MTKTIGKDEAVELIRHAVKLKGSDYVDPRSGPMGHGCQYVNGTTGQPLCIVGHALVELGVPTDALIKAPEIDNLIALPYDREGDPTGEPGRIKYLSGGGLAEVEDLEFTPEAVGAFEAAQSTQDAGDTWGQALAAAEESKPWAE